MERRPARARRARRARSTTTPTCSTSPPSSACRTCWSGRTRRCATTSRLLETMLDVAARAERASSASCSPRPARCTSAPSSTSSCRSRAPRPRRSRSRRSSSPRTTTCSRRSTARRWCRQSGLPFTIVRPHNFYGPAHGPVARDPRSCCSGAHAAPTAASSRCTRWTTGAPSASSTTRWSSSLRAAQAPEGEGRVLNVGRAGARGDDRRRCRDGVPHRGEAARDRAASAHAGLAAAARAPT